MAARKKASPNDCLRLDPVLDLKAASGLKDALAARRGKPLSLDASGVEHLGALCLQVLISARLSWAADGAGFAIHSASPDFEHGLALMGGGALAGATLP